MSYVFVVILSHVIAKINVREWLPDITKFDIDRDTNIRIKYGPWSIRNQQSLRDTYLIAWKKRQT